MVKPLIWAEGPPKGLYWTAAVQGPSSLWVEFAVWPHVHRKRTLYTRVSTGRSRFFESFLWVKLKAQRKGTLKNKVNLKRKQDFQTPARSVPWRM